MNFPLVGQAYVGRSTTLSSQECVNLFPEKSEVEGRSVAALHGTPGLTSFATFDVGPIRGMHVMDDFLYVVAAGSLYVVKTNGDITSLGIILGATRVSMQTNNIALKQLCIASDGYGYIYDTTNGLQQITDDDFQPPDVVRYLDGFFVFNWRESRKFFISNLDDGLTYDSVDVGEKTTAADDLISIIINHKEIWLFGSETTEAWFNAGSTVSAIFPFAQIESAFIERGCAAVYTPVKMDNTVYWLGDDLMVYRAQGYNAIRVSTHAIEYAIKQYTVVSDAFGFSYTEEGHTFYVLTFPTNGATWVYDSNTSMWHERRSLGLSRWRANCYAYYNNKHYVGDYTDGIVYEMNLDTYTEDGASIERIRSASYLHSEANPVFMDWLQIIIESGKGITSGQGSDPQAMLQYSDDGGKTWSSEKWRSMGKIGQYMKRVKWTQLGRFYQRVFRVTITDPIKIAILEADTSMDSTN
jgi:hypothetical protein